MSTIAIAFPEDPAFLIVGQPRHGKNTVAECIAEHTGLTWMDSSTTIYRFVSNCLGISEQALRWIPKERLRPILIAVGDYLTNYVDERYYPRTLFDLHHRIHVGLRRASDLRAFRIECAERGFDPIVIWVNNPNAPEVLDNLEIEEEDTDLTILNAVSVADLSEDVQNLIKELFGE